jgi:glutathione S-transferase
MSTLTLYTNPQSRGRIARWMLEEIGVPYATVVLPYGPGMKTPEYLAINPMGKVPTLVHGDAVVTEVAAVLAYLADVFPQAGLAPRSDDHAARAAYWRWLFFAAGPMEAAITDQALGVKVQAAGLRRLRPCAACRGHAGRRAGRPPLRRRRALQRRRRLPVREAGLCAGLRQPAQAA